jgi:triacylglycerol lipase
MRVYAGVIMSLLTTWPIQRYERNVFDNFQPTLDANFDFHPATARALMWASQLAYELDTRTSQSSVEKVKTILQRWNMEFVQAAPITGFPQVPLTMVSILPAITRDALVISGHGALIIAFAGTDPLRIQDWLVNFSALPAATTGVSTGLSDAAALFAQRLKPIIDSHANLKLFVTGHSLGGALGVAVAHELGGMNCTAEAVCTYGMPRAGDGNFAATYDARLGKRTFRFVHGDDLVPTVPPANLAGVRHQHVGWFIHCPRGGKFAVSQKSANTQSNEPVRDDDIVAGVLSQVNWVERLSTLALALLGGDLVQAIVDAAPERIRQHLQDQYIAALTP